MKLITYRIKKGNKKYQNKTVGKNKFVFLEKIRTSENEEEKNGIFDDME